MLVTQLLPSVSLSTAMPEVLLSMVNALSAQPEPMVWLPTKMPTEWLSTAMLVPLLLAANAHSAANRSGTSIAVQE
eukprot:gene39451-48754_t